MKQQEQRMDFEARRLPTAEVSRLPANDQGLQRACTCGQHAVGGECPTGKERHGGTLQRAAIISAAASAVAPPIVHAVLRAPGQPLNAATRAAMEPRFGRDFSGVRVHTDAQAAASAQAVNARAYTVGKHIAFGPGEFQPQSTTGQRLLAHELTHTVQQNGRTPSGTIAVQHAESPTEKIAERAATQRAPRLAGNLETPLVLARAPRPDVIDEVDTPLKETLVTGPGKTTEFGWNAKYSVYFYKEHVVIEVRIKINGAVNEKIKKQWLEGINAKWNNKYRFTNGMRRIGLSFWAIFTDLNPHVTVNVVNKPGISGDWNRRNWDASDGEGDTQGDAAAHEFGHMIANKDEYNLPDGKGGKKTLDGVMAHAKEEAKSRHFTQFLAWINAHRQPKEAAFMLEEVK